MPYEFQNHTPDQIVEFLEPAVGLPKASSLSGNEVTALIERISVLAKQFTLRQVGIVLKGLLSTGRDPLFLSSAININDFLWVLEENFGAATPEDIADVRKIIECCADLTYDKGDLSWGLERLVPELIIPRFNDFAPTTKSSLYILRCFAKLGYDSGDLFMANCLKNFAEKAKRGVENFGIKNLASFVHSVSKLKLFHVFFDNNSGELTATGRAVKERMQLLYDEIDSKTGHALLHANLFCERFRKQPFLDAREMRLIEQKCEPGVVSTLSGLQIQMKEMLEDMGYRNVTLEYPLRPFVRLADLYFEDRYGNVYILELDGPPHFEKYNPNNYNSATRTRNQLNEWLISLLMVSEQRERSRGNYYYVVLPYTELSTASLEPGLLQTLIDRNKVKIEPLPVLHEEEKKEFTLENRPIQELESKVDVDDLWETSPKARKVAEEAKLDEEEEAEEIAAQEAIIEETKLKEIEIAEEKEDESARTSQIDQAADIDALWATSEVAKKEVERKKMLADERAYNSRNKKGSAKNKKSKNKSLTKEEQRLEDKQIFDETLKWITEQEAEMQQRLRLRFLKEAIKAKNSDSVKDILSILANSGFDLNSPCVPQTELTFLGYAEKLLLNELQSNWDCLIQRDIEPKFKRDIEPHLRVIDILVAAGAEISSAKKNNNRQADKIFNWAVDDLQAYNAASFIVSRFEITTILLDEVPKTGSVSLIEAVVRNLPQRFTDEVRNHFWSIASAKNNFEQIAEVLLDSEVLPTDSFLSYKALILAIKGHNEELVRTLAVPEIMLRGKRRHLPLLHAIIEGCDPRIIDILLAAGADLSWNGESGTDPYPLTVACRSRNVLAAHKLIAAAKEGIKAKRISDERLLIRWLTHSEESDNIPLLHLATLLGLIEFVRILCELAKEVGITDYVNIKWKKGTTALHLAVSFNELNEEQKCTEMLLFLLSQGADPTAMMTGDDSLKIPVLHWAAFNGKLESVRILCDILKNTEGYPDIRAAENDRTPLHSAVMGDREKVVEYLLSIGANINSSFFAFQVRHNEGCEEDIVSQPPSGALQDCFMTAVHLAAKKGDFKLMSLLLKEGANPNPPSTAGITPLYLAATGLFPEICELLIFYEADVTIVNQLGCSLVHMTLAACEIQHLNPLDLNGRGGMTVDIIIRALEKSKKSEESIPSPNPTLLGRKQLIRGSREKER